MTTSSGFAGKANRLQPGVSFSRGTPSHVGLEQAGLWVRRTFRLTRSTDFKRVRRLGQSYAHPLVVLVITANETEAIRIGVTASHAVGGAVQRNRAKRRLKACFEEYLPAIRPGRDLVAVARRPIVDADFMVIRAAVARLLKQAGILVER